MSTPSAARTADPASRFLRHGNGFIDGSSLLKFRPGQADGFDLPMKDTAGAARPQRLVKSDLATDGAVRVALEGKRKYAGGVGDVA